MKPPVLCLFLLASISLLQWSCAPQYPVGILYGPSAEITATEYPRVLKTWTRNAKIYDGFASKAFITATFHSPEFRRAFALAYPDIHGHGGNITRRELVELAEGVEQYLNFFVSIYTANDKWNDLSQSDSIWRLTLKGAHGSTAAPVTVLPVQTDENLRAVYPYIGRFDKTYLVRFPLIDPLSRLLIPTSSEGFAIQIASALGKTELQWQLKPPQTNNESPALNPAATN